MYDKLKNFILSKYSMEEEEESDVMTEPKKKFLVFVYGSLLQGFSNNPRHLQEATLIGEYSTKKRYQMISLGGFPGVLKADLFDRGSISPAELASLGSLYRPIRGELYSVNLHQLGRLDMLEGNGCFYNREEVKLEGFDQPVWMYILMAREYYKQDPLVSKDDNRDYSWRYHNHKLAAERKGYYE